MRYGEPCPYCLVGIVEYDSLLNLVCKRLWQGDKRVRLLDNKIVSGQLARPKE